MGEDSFHHQEVQMVSCCSSLLSKIDIVGHIHADHPVSQFKRIFKCLYTLRSVSAICPGENRNSFYFPLFALFGFPVALVTLQVNTQKKIHSLLSFAGESTIWIQDDGLQVLHHYQERSDS